MDAHHTGLPFHRIHLRRFRSNADVQASGYLIGTDVVRPDRRKYSYGTVTPSNTTATRLWQNSARTIGDILVLSDIVNPFVYHALPFSNQPFVVAGCCYIKDADAQRQRQMGELNSGEWEKLEQGIFANESRDDDQAINNFGGSTSGDPRSVNNEEKKGRDAADTTSVCHVEQHHCIATRSGSTDALLGRRRMGCRGTCPKDGGHQYERHRSEDCHREA